MNNSGTSFMTELVVRVTGLSPGPARDLKRADSHNPRGYWEYLPLRSYIWRHTGGNFRERDVPSSPGSCSAVRAKEIAAMASAANVQVFKCFKFPWVYPWFGKPRQAILTRRAPGTVYKRHYKYQGWTLNEYRAVHAQYHDLAAKYLDEAWDVLWVHYEDFFADTQGAIKRVCSFLERPYHKRLLRVFRPRRPLWQA